MNLAVAPRVLATREIKKYFKKIGIGSTIRSGVTNKKGVFIDIFHEEVPHYEVKNLHLFIADIQKKYDIKTVEIKVDLPF